MGIKLTEPDSRTRVNTLISILGDAVNVSLDRKIVNSSLSKPQNPTRENLCNGNKLIGYDLSVLVS